MIQFLLNQTLKSESALDPNTTVLNYLRRNLGRCGTKEGCAPVTAALAPSYWPSRKAGSYATAASMPA
ncbi:Xanthine dehydrogenase, iron-sulfur cluster and FAD-binding subunit A [Serratia plymuthica]|uniref:Xanthine dehydrogenase, iron-sulfur cluster and FAD-binding subunit A n=1 Tax=Serratia plymuthica TaxID=82996 RepID=A0A2X4UUL1_SERPL|nr:Xanthine dehydrogenase, iron-sulfur cluster and FAD-binding subunit A [Serratia plymuthica]